MFTMTSHVPGHITVDVNVTDAGRGVFCVASLYWLFDLDNELDCYYIELIDDVKGVTFRDLDNTRKYVVDLFIRDNSYNSRVVRVVRVTHILMAWVSSLARGRTERRPPGTTWGSICI